VDLGCWPGSWLVTLARAVGPDGRVVGIDLEATDAVAPNVVVLVGDFTEPAVQDEIAAALGRPADAILCDAAPKLTGIRDVDQGAIEELWQAALALARRLLRQNGFMIVKGFPGQEGDLFRKELKRSFADLHEVRPEGKRATSKEFYWVASGWRGFGSPTRIASENSA
jgi:23S rRNA (uridine2552-2'-O)-methyltransferase